MSTGWALISAYLVVGMAWASFRSWHYWRHAWRMRPPIPMPLYWRLFAALCMLGGAMIGWACVAVVWPHDLWRWDQRDRPDE